MERFKGWGKRERPTVTAFFVAGLLAGACSSSHLLGDLGTGGQGGTGPGPGGRDGGLVPIDAGYPGDVSQLGASETWVGYLENFQFPSGSDAVKLSFATDPTGVVVGTVTFGAGPPPPPATDPDAAYPPGATQVPINTVVEGFPYTIARGTLTGSRLRFTVWETEVWSTWCALQTPVPGSDWCLPYGNYYSEYPPGTCYKSDPDPSVPPTVVNCVKMYLCTYGVCACGGAGCVVSFSNAIDFDMAISFNDADGSIVGQLGDHNVRVTHVP